MDDKIDLKFTTVKKTLPEFIENGIKSYAKESNSYHRQSKELIELIATHHGLSQNMIYLTAGADQALFLLMHKHGASSHVFTPTYIGYSDVKNFGYELTEHYSLNKGTYEIDTGLIDDASLIMLANPSNPAGITSRKNVLKLCSNNKNALVVVDEAYGDFADESVIKDVADNANLVVVRSFSKNYALAGFRIGYIVASNEVLKTLQYETTWFNTAHTSVGAAVHALNNSDYFLRMRDEIKRERNVTEKHLSQLGYNLIESHINAVLIEMPDNKEAVRLVEYLEGKNILVNQGSGESNIGLNDNYIRVSIGTPQQMIYFREIVKEYGKTKGIE